MNFNNVRIALKYADLAAWEASSLVLNAGEVAIAVVPVGESFDVMFKVGDGSKTFKDLEWAYSNKVDKDELATALAGYYTEAEVDTLIAGCVSDSEWEEHIEAFEALSETVASLHNYNDTELRQLIAEEVTRATGAEEALGKRIDNEATARQQGDEAANTAAQNAQTKADQAYELAQTKIDLEDLESKNYATKTEAQEYANAKDEAIAAAKAVADAAKAAIDAFLDENAVSDDVVNTLKEIQAGLDSGEQSAASLLNEINKIKDGTTVVPKATDADTVDGKQAADFATAEQGAKADTALQSADLNDINAAIAAINNANTGILAQAKKYTDDTEKDTTYDATNGIKLEGTTFSIDESAEWIFNCGGAN